MLYCIYVLHPIKVESHIYCQIEKCQVYAQNMSQHGWFFVTWQWHMNLWNKSLHALNVLHRDIDMKRWSFLLYIFPINRTLSNMNEQSFLLNERMLNILNDLTLGDDRKYSYYSNHIQAKCSCVICFVVLQSAKCPYRIFKKRFMVFNKSDF